MRIELKIEGDRHERGPSYCQVQTFTTSLEVAVVGQAAVQAIMVQAVASIIAAEAQAVTTRDAAIADAKLPRPAPPAVHERLR